MTPLAAPAAPPPPSHRRVPLVVVNEDGRLVVRQAREAERRWLSRALEARTAVRGTMGVT